MGGRVNEVRGSFCDLGGGWDDRSVADIFPRKNIPEINTEPIRIGFHIAAEMATAALLLISGILILHGSNVGNALYLVAVGVLFYTCIVSPGYFSAE